MTDTPRNIWIIDDDPAINQMLKDFLADLQYSTKVFSSADQAFEFIRDDENISIDEIDAIVTDLNMPGMDGLEFIERMKKFAPDIPIIMITAFATIDSAIEATKKGAFCYLAKPFKLKEFEVSLEKAIQLRDLKLENARLLNNVKDHWRFDQIIGKSRSMMEVFDQIQKIAPSQATVLITGESGTGKELVARAIHNRGKRKQKPFIPINCTAIPDTLLESELFGHAKGAFTGAIDNKVGLFEEADGGTIFLDEIGDLDMGLQAKILRTLQEKTIKPVGSNKEKKVDVRIVVATHKDLKLAIKEGRFREDLYYRLSVLPIHLPPLRQRKDDIPLLATHFLKKYAKLNESQTEKFSGEALKALTEFRWDGNVRELENIIERMVIMCEGKIITEDFLPKLDKTNPGELFSDSVSDWPTLEEFNNRYIRLVLKKTGGKKEKAAQILGINRRTIYRKEKELFGESGEQES